MSECPHKAIETGHGYTTAIIYFFYSVFVVWFWPHLYKYVSIPKNSFGDFLSFVFESVLFMTFLFPGYFIIHYLYRLPVMRQIIDFTSLTHFKFWGRYKTAKKYR
jgi:hypothetical protein